MMLQLFTSNTAGTAVPATNPIIFTEKLLATSDSKCVTVPISQITLTDPGYYIVHFDGNIAAETSGLTGVEMFVDGSAYTGATTGLVAATSASPENVSFTAIIHVKRSCACACNSKTLQFVVQESNALIYDANIVVVRVS